MNSKFNLAALEQFTPQQMTKIDIFQSPRFLLGLNCLEPGQSQRLHTHADADKFYYVIRGRARFHLGDQTVEAGAGELVICPAAQPHGIAHALEQTSLLVGIAPWQRKT